jgi:nucleoside-diphosphate-sugar epimerase
MTHPPIKGCTVVVTGATGQVGGPVARALAVDNEVVAAARFSDPEARAGLEAAGIRCVPVDLTEGRVGDLPADADYVLNFAVAKSNKWDRDIDANAGGLASLIEHHASARAVLHCSSTAVYRPMGHHVFAEDDDLGDNHGVWPFLRTYSISKIAAEGAARWAARRFGTPTTIARLSVPYGDGGGWPAIHLEMMRNGSAIPVHLDAPSVYHPLHEDDIVAMLPGLLAGASVPATTVNWGGEDPVSIEDWCGYLGELTGLTPAFTPTADTIDSVQIDLTRMHDVAGTPAVRWKDGFRRMVAARRPELLDGA